VAVKQCISAERFLRDIACEVDGLVTGQEQRVMSQRELEAVIGRAVLDEAFRHLLFAEPEAALTGYRLSSRERAALRSMDAESLEDWGGKLGKRIRKAHASPEPNPST
jgi:hypothetical protein